MAKKLNKDGLPTDVPSAAPPKAKGLFRGLESGPKEDTSEQDQHPRGRSVIGRGELPTRPAVRPHADLDAFAPAGGEPRTIVAVGRKRSASESKDLLPASDPMADPVVGWLVVVGGPGRGSAVRLGSGQNSVGRGPKSRARVDFGDRNISRESHAIVTYDPRNNRFYIQQGAGTNLTYLGGEPVLSPTALRSGSVITLGETTLRFVAFCDEDFTWNKGVSSQ